MPNEYDWIAVILPLMLVGLKLFIKTSILAYSMKCAHFTSNPLENFDIFGLK